MSVLRREQRYVQQFCRRLADIERRANVRVELRVDVQIDISLVIIDGERPQPKPNPDDLPSVLARRNAWLAAHGMRTIHTRKGEALDVDGVLRAIKKEIDSIPVPPHAGR